MVEAADSRQLNHHTTLLWLRLDRTFKRSILAEAIVGSVVVVIVKIGREESLQVTFIHHDDVIQTVSAD